MKLVRRIILGSLMTSMLLGNTLVAAQEISISNTRLAEAISNNSKVLGMSQEKLDDTFNMLVKGIKEEYSGMYELENFTYEAADRTDNGKKFVDIDVIVDMTLTQHPSDSPYVHGMEQALAEETNQTKQDKIQNEIDGFINMVEKECYQVQEKAVFTYSVEIGNKIGINSTAVEDLPVYYRYDLDEGTQLIDNNDLEDIRDTSAQEEKGYTTIKEANYTAGLNEANTDTIKNEHGIMATKSFKYNRIKARDWAVANAYKPQEYPSSQVEGTDCANFVSKALHAGGIPEDKAGKWFQAPTWGGWAGLNWLRTGYTSDTGVKNYMVDKKHYFTKQTNEAKVAAGAFMYWTTTSHVALVTYGDGTTIKYAQHGARQDAYAVYKRSSKTPITFYVPSSNIQ